MVLPQSEPVVVPGGKVADVERNTLREAGDLSHLSLQQKPIGNAPLVENLDRTGMQATRARTREGLAGTPLEHGDVHTSERQLSRQHEARGSGSNNYYGVRRHDDDGGPGPRPYCKAAARGILRGWTRGRSWRPFTRSAPTPT